MVDNKINRYSIKHFKELNDLREQQVQLIIYTRNIKN